MEEKIKQIEDDLMECKTEVGQQMELLRVEMAEIKKEVGALLEIFQAGEGFLKVMGWAGVAVKWFAGIGIALAAIWYLVTHGHWPPQ